MFFDCGAKIFLPLPLIYRTKSCKIVLICDVMGQNQSHVAIHKMTEISIFSENVKICPFFLFHQKQTICVSFCHLN